MSSAVIIISIVAIVLIIGCVFVINANSKRSESESEPRKSIDPPPIAPAPAPAPAPTTPPAEKPKFSKKEASVHVYNDCDCESNIIRGTTVGAGASLDMIGEISAYGDDQWKCINSKNMNISNFEVAYSGVNFGGDASYEGQLNMLDEFNNYKIGCEPGDDRFRTDGLKFNWKIRE